MSESHKRGPRGTVMRQVFLAIKRGARTVAAIQSELGLEQESVQTACKHLRKAGYIQRADANRRHAIWVAMPGRRAPEDRRGKEPGSRNHEARKNMGAAWFQMMRAKHGPGWHPRAEDPTALAQAWPMQRQEVRA